MTGRPALVLIATPIGNLGDLSSRAVIEAEAGAFDRWGVHVGDQVEVRS